jgi:hypothetical protein
MNKTAITGTGLLMLALAAGCGGAGEETVIKDQLALMKEMTAAYEKVTDADSFKKEQAEVEKLKQRAEELKRKYDAWPEEKKKQFSQKYQGELEAATERLAKARAAARKKAGGGKSGPP